MSLISFISYLFILQGDSGGPIFLQRDDKHHEIIGIVSWGNKHFECFFL